MVCINPSSGRGAGACRAIGYVTIALQDDSDFPLDQLIELRRAVADEVEAVDVSTWDELAAGESEHDQRNRIIGEIVLLALGGGDDAVVRLAERVDRHAAAIKRAERWRWADALARHGGDRDAAGRELCADLWPPATVAC